MDRKEIILLCAWLVALVGLVVIGFYGDGSDVFVDPAVTGALSSNWITGAVTGGEDATAPVIVVLKDVDESDVEERKEEIEDLQEELLEDLGGFVEEDVVVTKEYETISAISAELTKEGLDELERSDLVERIVYDKKIELFLDESQPLLNADDAHALSVNGYAINGQGQAVCVIDTGVDYTHSAFGSCTSETFLAGNCSVIVAGIDIADNDSDPMDLNNHGTHVAGIVASRDETYPGVAPGVSIVAAKVFPGSSGTTTATNLLAGIDWCTSNAEAYNITLLTMSLGDDTSHSEHCDDDVLAIAVNDVVDAGIFVDVSSGNNGFSNGISSPACASKVAAVGATDVSDAISSGSNSAAILDLLAPGISITSSVLDNSFASKSGTSMASPHVAGVAVLVRQYWQLVYNETIAPSDIISVLQNSGVMLNDSRNGYEFARVDALAAIQPHITFSGDSVANEVVLTSSSAFVNVSFSATVNNVVLSVNLENGTTMNYSMDSSDDGYSYTLNDLTSGNYTYTVSGSDAVGTVGESTRSFVVSTQPGIEVVAPVSGSFFNSAFAMNVTVSSLAVVESSSYDVLTSNGTAIRSATVTVNDSSYTWEDVINVSDDGEYSLNVSATTGVEEVSTLVAFTRDTVAPSVSNVTPANGTFVGSSFGVSAVVTDENDFGAVVVVDNVSYDASLSDGLWKATINGSALSEGEHVVVVVGVDAAGNENDAEGVIVNVDLTAPEVGNLTPVNGSSFDLEDVVEFDYVASDSSPSVLSCDIMVDGVASANGSFAAGTHEWFVQCTDEAGNVGVSEAWQFVVAETDPVVTLSSPADGHVTTNATVTFDCSATDDEALSNITLYGSWDGGTLEEKETTLVSGVENSSSFEFTLEEGSYSWNCFVGDSDANKEFASADYSITVDQTGPVISSVASSVDGVSVEITWTTDEESDSLVEYGIETFDQSESGSDLVTEHSIVLEGLDVEEEYGFNVTSCDVVDNCEIVIGDAFTTGTAESSDDSDSSDSTASAAGGSGGGGGGAGGAGDSVADLVEEEFAEEEQEEVPEVAAIEQPVELAVANEEGVEESSEASANFLSGAAVVDTVQTVLKSWVTWVIGGAALLGLVAFFVFRRVKLRFKVEKDEET